MAFLIDDLFLLPFKSVCDGIMEAVEQDLQSQEAEIMAALTQLHRRLESGEIDQEEFDEEETALLDRLENVQKLLHPEPPLTKTERLKKHFPEEFEEDEPKKSDWESGPGPEGDWGPRLPE